MFANARMYSINAATAAAWRTLLQWVVDRAQVACEVIDYPPPQPLADLWGRSDMGCAFMCGYPYARSKPRPLLLAAPVPKLERCSGEPIYWTDIVVRADSPIRDVAGAFGHRFAFTAEDSQSGWHAPRALLAPFAQDHGGPLFSEVVGPLRTPRRVVEAVIAGDTDVGPLDSYAHALLRMTEPELAGGLRVIASTSPTAIPTFVAAVSTPPADVRRITEALLAVHESAWLAPARATLCLERFARVPPGRYDALLVAAQQADSLGYPKFA
ncbi:MAG: PhnD/SsuA/transferrin family substrate-binding protein [Casimicrobiaceae bacterium]